MSPEPRVPNPAPHAFWCLGALAAALCGSARAQPVAVRSTAADRRVVDVTVYNSNMALVREVRDVALPAGEVELAFEDVAAQVRPETVHVKDLGETGALHVVEQNYRYDILDPRSLMEHYVGRDVDLVHVVPGTGQVVRDRATLLSTGLVRLAGGGYLDNGAGPATYVYRMSDGVTFGGPWRIVLGGEVPEDFVSRPTLFWLLDGSGGRRAIETSYLTRGMNWRADYVLMLSQDERRGDLTGWVTLTNQSGIGFDDAGLRLVAGEVNVVTAYGSGAAMHGRLASMFVAAAARAPAFVEEGMFEYHLYTLQRRTDLADREQKQIELLRGSGFPIEKKYRLRGIEYWFTSRITAIQENLHPAVWLEFVNAQAAGLGMPLPAGTVRVYQAEAGRGAARQFLGEDSIVHTPREEHVKLQVGAAFDIVAERRQMDYESLADGLIETKWKITIRNRKPETVVVEVIEPTSGDWTVMDSSLTYEKVSSRELRFDVTCPPDREVVLTYTLRVKYY